MGLSASESPQSIVNNDVRCRSGWILLPSRCLIALFRVYQCFISPILPPACRFVPTCSQYAIEAVGKHGVLRGGLLTLWRIARCHPFARGGYDPVR